MTQVGRIARKGMKDKTLMFAPLCGSKAPVAPSESAIPNGMAEFLNYVHVHDRQKNKLTKKVGEEGWVVKLTVNLFSYKKPMTTSWRRAQVISWSSQGATLSSGSRTFRPLSPRSS